MKNILIIGFGKMGKIKASIWHSLGAKIFILDTEQTTSAIVPREYTSVNSVYDFFVKVKTTHYFVDIVTPNGTHMQVLEDVCKHAVGTSVTIIIEKPAFSSLDEMRMLDRISASSKQVNLLVSENYMSSLALHQLKQLLEQKKADGLTIQKIEVNFSKNRMQDVGTGRFYDKELGPYGIELPHMLACLDAIGVTIDSLEIKKSLHLHFSEDIYDEGVYVVLASTTGIHIVLNQSLGSFSVDEQLDLNQNKLERWIQVQLSDSSQIRVDFDPVATLPRYTSRLQVSNQTPVISDNHLRAHLQAIFVENTDYMNKISVNHLRSSNELLLKIAAQRQHKHLHAIIKETL